MNLYFRLLYLLLRLPWLAKQSAPLATSSLSMRVMPNDLDLNFHVNNGRYLTLLDLGRLHLMATTQILVPLLRRKWMPVLGSVQVQFIRPLRVFEKFTMTTQVVYWDEKWIYLEQKIFKKETLCLVALIKTLFTAKEKKISPQDIMKLFSPPPIQPFLPENIRIWQEAEKINKANTESF